MIDFSQQIISGFTEEGLSVDELIKAQRVAWVKNLWKRLVEQPILDHTNGVYIFQNNDRNEMHIYLDDSMYASEVSNRKALIYQECRLKYNEPIDDVYVHVSQGSRKKQYPFKEQVPNLEDQNDPIPLTPTELSMVEQACKKIPDLLLRQRFKEAMISDLEWKKGNK